MLLPYSTHLVHYAVIFFTLTKMYIPQGIAMKFNKNKQRELTGNTTQYYQNTTKGFEFLCANFKIKATSKIAKGDKWKSQLQLSILCALHLFIWVYISTNMNITERDVELQKEKCKKLTIANGDNWESKNKSCSSFVVHLFIWVYTPTRYYQNIPKGFGGTCK